MLDEKLLQTTPDAIKKYTLTQIALPERAQRTEDSYEVNEEEEGNLRNEIKGKLGSLAISSKDNDLFLRTGQTSQLNQMARFSDENDLDTEMELERGSSNQISGSNNIKVELDEQSRKHSQGSEVNSSPAINPFDTSALD